MSNELMITRKSQKPNDLIRKLLTLIQRLFDGLEILFVVFFNLNSTGEISVPDNLLRNRPCTRAHETRTQISRIQLLPHPTKLKATKPFQTRWMNGIGFDVGGPAAESVKTSSQMCQKQIK